MAAKTSLSPSLMDKGEAKNRAGAAGTTAREEAEKIMVQVFMVVRCYSCETFQVHQVKKINKWLCKVCNKKQSILKTYGKGTARDCRKHVQKLNMARGESERGVFRDKEGEGSVEEERGERERSTDRGEGGRRGLRGSHPPCDYANTFTTQSGSKETQGAMHPVMLATGKRSKWTTFIEPPRDDDEDDDDGVCTTDSNGFAQASKNRRKTRRSLSERKPHPFSTHDQNEKVCPYSSVNQEFFDDQAIGLTARASHSDRYTKLEGASYSPPLHQEQQQQQDGGSHGRHSHSMFNLTSIPSANGNSPGNHKEWMSQIKQDLEQFSRHHHHGQDCHDDGKVTRDTGRCGKQPQTDGSGGDNVKVIPKISTRWSQFMCEPDTDSDDDNGSLLTSGGPLKGKGPDHSVHILASKSTISKFTLIQDL